MVLWVYAVLKRKGHAPACRAYLDLLVIVDNTHTHAVAPMIDAISIFTKGGVVLWSYCFIKLKDAPIDRLVQTVLLEERAGTCAATVDKYNMKWLMKNDLDLVFVVLYQGIQSLAYLDCLLRLTQLNFLGHLRKYNITFGKGVGGSEFGPTFFLGLPRLPGKEKLMGTGGANGYMGIPSFDHRFLKIFDRCDDLQKMGFRNKHPSTIAASSRWQAKKGGSTKRSKHKNAISNENEQDDDDDENGDDGDDDDEEELLLVEDDEELLSAQLDTNTKNISNGGDKTANTVGTGTTAPPSDYNIYPGDIHPTQIVGLRKRGEPKGRPGGAKGRKDLLSTITSIGKQPVSSQERTTAKPKKKAADWGSQKVTARAMAALDYSKKPDDESITSQQQQQTRSYGLYGYSECGDAAEDSDVLEEDEVGEEEENKGLFARLSSAVKGYTGNKQLNSSDLEGVLGECRLHLMSKNVAADIADMVTASVKQSLTGRTTQMFTTVKQTVKEAMTHAVQRILTPKKSIDVLRAALEAKEQGRVYSIAFLGVNGVGKSTNLAKVCYLLKNKGELKVLIAACDTFRAGAVEQLLTHAKCLNVELFQRGYNKDAAQIAKEALTYANTEGFDVVLIDTAGRMQDNEPLMRSLSKLVWVNQPDLVLFVGEALVGNDAVDQLRKFNQCLVDMCPGNSGRSGVDGIILTKVDTVDDKIGAALSMAYITGQPIVFVGTGQRYTNLRTLQVNSVVKALLG